MLFLDSERQTRPTLHDAQMPDIVESVLNAGHVLNLDPGIIDGFAAALLDLDFADLFRGQSLAHGADVDLVLLVFEITGRRLDVFLLDGGLHIDDGQLQRLELVIIHPDAEIALAVTAENDFANTGQDAEFIRKHGLDVLRQAVERTLSRNRQQQNRLLLGIDLVHGRFVGTDRQLDRADLGLDFGQRRVDVAVDVEFERDGRLSLLDVRRHPAQALRGNDRFLDGIDHFGFHDGWRGPRPGKIDRQHRKIDVGQFAHAQSHQTDGAEDNKSRHQHPGENRPPDGKIG